MMRECKNIVWSSKQLIKMITKGTLRFDIYVQRNECWDETRKSKLIRTMLNGFPKIPDVYFTKYTDENYYQGIDGRQRISTVFRFTNNEFPLVNVADIIDEDGNEIELNGKYFKDLSEDLQDVIMSYIWRINYYEDLTDDEIRELFELINSGKPLTSIELSRVNAKQLNTIQEIGKHEIFKTALTEKAFARYTHEDMVIKSFIMLTFDTPCLDTKVVRPTMETANFTDEIINDLNAVYDRILNTYKTIVSDTSEETGKLSKRIAKRLITRTHMLSILPIVKRSLDENVSDEMFTNWVKNFFCGTKSVTKYNEYNTRCTAGSGHAENIKVRMDVIRKDYEKFMKQYEKKKEENVDEVESETETQNETATETDDQDTISTTAA